MPVAAAVIFVSFFLFHTPIGISITQIQAKYFMCKRGEHNYVGSFVCVFEFLVVDRRRSRKFEVCVPASMRRACEAVTL